MIPIAAAKSESRPQRSGDGRDEPFVDGQWQAELADAVRTVEPLLTHLKLTEQQLTQRGIEVDPDSRFALRVPWSFVHRMQLGDPADPLLLQVLPQREERVQKPGFIKDPLAEAQATTASGLLSKYAGRSLIVTTGACAVHCRYCFRRHFPYSAHGPKLHQQLLAAVRADTSLTEVILSGGDPLSLPDDHLVPLLEAFAAIEHVQRVRLHTRLPVVLPARVTQTLTACLANLGKPVVIVLHANHPNELDANTARAFGALATPNITRLNQSVLLRGVNNDPQTLAALSETLFSQGVLPYYLHLPDRVEGTAHFYIERAQGQAIAAVLNTLLPGYLVPKLVEELPGGQSKTLIATS